MQQAIDYEIRWQIEQIEDGHAIQQATVLFDPTRAKRVRCAPRKMLRTTATSPILICHRHISEQWVKERAQMAELPRTMAARVCGGLWPAEYDATTLTQSKAMAAYFEAAAKACGQPSWPANWIMGEVSRRLNMAETGIEQAPVTAAQLAALIGRIADGTDLQQRRQAGV